MLVKKKISKWQVTEINSNTFESNSNNVRTLLYLRMIVEESEDSLRREQKRVHELQQQLEQERAVSLHKEKEEEERKGVRTDMNRILITNIPAERVFALWLHFYSSFMFLFEVFPLCL